MKSLSGSLIAHVGEEVTTLCTCWDITLKDGEVKRFTGLDVDITIGGQVYKSTTGLSASGIPSSSSGSVNSVDVQSYIDDEDITEEDIAAGRYDNAAVTIFKVNYDDPDGGKIIQQIGTVGEITVEGDMFIAEVRGRMQQLQNPIGELYSPSCRALLFDSRCKVSKAFYAVDATVTAVNSRREFEVDQIGSNPTGHFLRGSVEWQDGENAGVTSEIRDNVTTVITLMLPPTGIVEVGDTVKLNPGCDKSLFTCKNEYDNLDNFRGEPYIPSMAKIVAPLET